MTSEATRRLRDAGLRVTAPRLTVLGVLAEQRGHHDVGTVTALARERLGTLSTQAAYDVLHALAEAGLARRIQPAGSPALFEIRVGDNHHHLVCRACGRVEDVDCVVGEAPCLEPSTNGAYRVDEAEVTFWGMCTDCSSDDKEHR